MIGEIFKAAVPIAAGFAFPGFGAGLGLASGVGAGFVAGAGLAALTGDDPLTGGIFGGLGGYTGGGFKSAADATALGADGLKTTAQVNKVAASPFTSASVDPKTMAFAEGKAPFIPSNYTAPTGGPQQIASSIQTGQAPNMGFRSMTSDVAGGGGYTSMSDSLSGAGKAFQTIADKPGEFVKNLGGGNTAMGVGKLGITGLGIGASAGAFNPEPVNIAAREEEKYDPRRSLNLGSINTGIDEALRRDTGLRLLAQGGQVQRYNNGGMAAMYGMTPVAPPPEYGKIDVAGKFVKLSDDPGPGMITKSEYEEQYLPSSNEETKKQEGSSAFESGLEGSADKGSDVTQGAISALAQGFAAQQMNPPTKSQTLGLESLEAGGYLETGGEVGDGMSDDIEATIDGEQPARLSDGEFVIPADVVSHLGNGSSDAGAKKLYQMMDKIRMARTGTKKQGKEIKPERYMPA